MNVTPDSFSDGGRFLAIDAAVAHAKQLEADGADILDIGGESTRPGAEPVTVDEELRRVVPVIERLVRESNAAISIDTTKAEVAAAALAVGAHIVNDISGLQFDPRMIDVCREHQAGIVCMHIQGTPQTMQLAPHYDNVVDDLLTFFRRRLDVLLQAGIDPATIVLDPGVGFGKTPAQNVEILSSIARFQGLGHPVLIGHSRKGFLKKLLGRDVDERLAGSLGVSVALAAQGCDILRVHDVAAHRDAIVAWQAIRQTRVDPH